MLSHLFFRQNPLDPSIWHKPHQGDEDVHRAGDPLTEKCSADADDIEDDI